MVKKYWEWEPVFKLNKNESALLVIDMQNAFLDKGGALEVPMAREQIPAFKKVISYCRENKIPVIYTKFCVGEDFNYTFFWKIAEQRGLKLKDPHYEMWDGKPETEIYSELAPMSDELVINKYGYDCFAETNLEEELQRLGISNLIFTGTVLNWCVDSTIRAAYHKHYDITVISDAVSSYDHAGATAKDWHEMELNLFAEAFGRVMSSNEFIAETTNQAQSTIK